MMSGMEIGFFVPLTDQAMSFLSSCGVGVGITLCYTLLRSITRWVDNVFVTACGDILFFFLLALCEFLFLFSVQGRQMRWFILLGQGIGIFVCWQTISPIMYTIIGKFLKVFRRVLEVIFSPVVKLNALIGGFVKKITSKITIFLKKYRNKLKTLLKSPDKQVYNETESRDK